MTNLLPAWSNFGSATNVTSVGSVLGGDYFTHFWDGYIFYETTTTKYFGITGDDDVFLWIIKGDKKWSSTGHPNRASYTWITSNIANSTLVCSHPNRHGPASNYTGGRAGSYTFQANTLYTILISMTEHGGGQNIFVAISNSSSKTAIFTCKQGNG